MLQSILKARESWERDHGRKCVSVHASAAVIDRVRHDALGLSECCVPLAPMTGKMSFQQGCDWYIDPALSGAAFRFE